MSHVSSNTPAPGGRDSVDELAGSSRPSQDRNRPGRTQSARIKKKRTSAAAQQASHTRTASATTTVESSRAVAAAPPPQQAKAARRGSLRNAVRRIFGRKPSHQDNSQSSSIQNSPQNSPIHTVIRHSHGTSDPSGLRPIPEQPAAVSPTHPRPRVAALSSENLRSTSVDAPIVSSARSPRSPYAVEFPHSAKLKPLDLGNPFHKPPGELKRRATLPSVVLDKDEAAALAKAIRVNDDDAPSPEEDERPKTSGADDGIGVAVTTSAMRKQHRRSRSADDLRRMALSLNPPRQRREEIHFWRQSIASTLPRRVVPVIVDDGNKRSPVSPIAHPTDDPFVIATTGIDDDQEVSPIVNEGSIGAGVSTVVVEAADLESRVLKLETDLARFQGALDRLTAQQNRRTIVLDSNSQPTRSRQNTPSVLVNSLLDADHRYSTYSAAGRDAYTTDPPVDTTGTMPATPLTPRQHYQPTSPSHRRNFSRLHTMIDQERHARRTLEDQVRDLQQSVQDMQDQLSQPIMRFPAYRRSQAPSQPYPLSDQMRPTSDYQGPAQLEAPNNRLTSRFSMSESLTDSEAARLRSARTSGSDAMRAYEDLPTPVDGHYPSHGRANAPAEGAMF